MDSFYEDRKYRIREVNNKIESHYKLEKLFVCIWWPIHTSKYLYRCEEALRNVTKKPRIIYYDENGEEL
jgi:hypothetical protein